MNEHKMTPESFAITGVVTLTPCSPSKEPKFELIAVWDKQTQVYKSVSVKANGKTVYTYKCHDLNNKAFVRGNARIFIKGMMTQAGIDSAVVKYTTVAPDGSVLPTPSWMISEDLLTLSETDSHA